MDTFKLVHITRENKHGPCPHATVSRHYGHCKLYKSEYLLSYCTAMENYSFSEPVICDGVAE